MRVSFLSTDLLRAGGEQEEIDFIRLAKGEVLGPRSTAGAAADSVGSDRTSVISSGATTWDRTARLATAATASLISPRSPCGHERVPFPRLCHEFLNLWQL